MSSNSTITVLGILVLVLYGLIKLLDFLEIGIDKYGSYLAFYVFLIISSFILKRNY
jgi:hypothetical protein